MSATAQVLAPLTLIGVGLVAGTFFAFSSFVLPALAALPAPEGVRAMQSINEVVLGSPFLVVFGGTALTSLCLGLFGLSSAHHPVQRAGWVGGAVFYLVGVVLVTAVGNVPLNEALAKVSPDAAFAVWPDYVAQWVAWNHVRTLAGTVSLVLYVLALLFT